MDSDPINRIEDHIVKGSENFFDDQDSRCDLHVTIRIAHDFYKFLEKFGENPPTGEITYVSDTIRSGMDQFFLLADSCTVINVDPDNWHIRQHTSWDFPALRYQFLHGFERLANSPDAGAAQMLSWLLELTHLELVFMALHFPSAIFGDLKEFMNSRRK